MNPEGNRSLRPPHVLGLTPNHQANGEYDGPTGDRPGPQATLLGPFGSGRFEDRLALVTLNRHIRLLRPGLSIRAVDRALDKAVEIPSVGGIPVNCAETPFELNYLPTPYCIALGNSRVSLSSDAILELVKLSFAQHYVELRTRFLRAMGWLPANPYFAIEANEDVDVEAAKHFLQSWPNLEVVWFTDATPCDGAPGPTSIAGRVFSPSQTAEEDIVVLLAGASQVMVQTPALDAVAHQIRDRRGLPSSHLQHQISALKVLLEETAASTSCVHCERCAAALKVRSGQLRRSQAASAEQSIAAEQKLRELQGKVDALTVELQQERAALESFLQQRTDFQLRTCIRNLLRQRGI